MCDYERDGTKPWSWYFINLHMYANTKYKTGQPDPDADQHSLHHLHRGIHPLDQGRSRRHFYTQSSRSSSLLCRFILFDAEEQRLFKMSSLTVIYCIFCYCSWHENTDGTGTYSKTILTVDNSGVTTLGKLPDRTRKCCVLSMSLYTVLWTDGNWMNYVSSTTTTLKIIAVLPQRHKICWKSPVRGTHRMTPPSPSCVCRQPIRQYVKMFTFFNQVL